VTRERGWERRRPCYHRPRVSKPFAWRVVRTLPPLESEGGSPVWYGLAGGAAAVTLLLLRHPVAAATVFGAGVALGALAAASTPARRVVRQAALGVLLVLSLVPVYLLVLTPWARARAWGGRAPRRRPRDAAGGSFWERPPRTQRGGDEAAR